MRHCPISALSPAVLMHHPLLESAFICVLEGCGLELPTLFESHMYIALVSTTNLFRRISNETPLCLLANPCLDPSDMFRLINMWYGAQKFKRIPPLNK